jgi:hypothetical protein
MRRYTPWERGTRRWNASTSRTATTSPSCQSTSCYRSSQSSLTCLSRVSPRSAGLSSKDSVGHLPRYVMFSSLAHTPEHIFIAVGVQLKSAGCILRVLWQGCSRPSGVLDVLVRGHYREPPEWGEPPRVRGVRRTSYGRRRCRRVRCG